jgi:hypothetical protein
LTNTGSGLKLASCQLSSDHRIAGLRELTWGTAYWQSSRGPRLQWRHAGNELNQDNHEFIYNRANYWIYTFMTRNGVLHYLVWRKMDEGQGRVDEARTDLIQRLKEHLDNP